MANRTETDDLEIILVADVGGNNAKLRLSSQTKRRRVPTGPKATPEQVVSDILEATRDWSYAKVTIGCPAPVRNNRLTLEPHNLGKGWVDFDFEEAFGRPTKLINDAAMQALGSYEGGKMLFLGLGTGLGAALVIAGTVLQLEVAHLPYRDKLTFEDFLGQRGLDRLGRKAWRKTLFDAVARLKAALVAEYVVLGGGNIQVVRELPPDCRAGSNKKAFEGGIRLWRERVVVA